MILLTQAKGAVSETSSLMVSFHHFINSKTPSLISFGLKVLLALVIFMIGHRLINWARKAVRTSMTRAKADTGICQFVDSCMKFGLHLLLILGIANKFGVESTSTAALIASGGMAVSLAMQGSLSNLAGGMLILLLKPFVVGDYIKEDAHGNEGTVKEIQIFYTKLATVDNKTIVIPNGTLANTSMTNVTAKAVRQLDLRIDISYDASIKQAKELLLSLLEENEKILHDMDYKVFVSDLAESSVIMGVRGWVKTEDYWETKWQLLEDIKYTLDENNIDIPYRHLTVHLNN